MNSIISECAVLHLLIFPLAYYKLAKFMVSVNRVITTQYFGAKPTDSKTTSQREESEEMLALHAE